jgi:hypothetical protein
MAKKTCHSCGLEDIEALGSAEYKHVISHRSSRPTEPPCVWSIRNPESKGFYDFWDEQWTLLSNEPTFDDTDAHQRQLLITMAGIERTGER